MAAGALGYLVEVWENEFGVDPPLGVGPSPDDYLGIIKGTARHWSFDPSDSSYCTSCDVSDFGPGKLDVAKAQHVLTNIFEDMSSYLNCYNLAVNWHDAGVVIDSVDAPFGSIREYTVRKLVPIPPTAMTSYPQYLAWPNCLPTQIQAPHGHVTTSLLSYRGGLMSPEGWQIQWYLATHGLTSCELEPIGRQQGAMNLIGHNFAQVFHRVGFPDSVAYVVRPEDFWMTYTVVTSLWTSPEGVSAESRLSARRASIDLGRNPTDGLRSVRLNLFKSTEAKLSVVDVSGREIAQLFEGHLRPGVSLVECAKAWPKSAQRAGVYWIILRTGSGSTNTRLLILR